MYNSITVIYKIILAHIYAIRLIAVNNEAVKARKAAPAEFRKEGKKNKIPERVIDQVHYLQMDYINARE